VTTEVLPDARPRKQLSDQLDRLDEQLLRHDATLDALGEHLNAAVADAARDATRDAVKDAVVALLTDPDLRQALYTASAPPADPKPGPWAKLRAAVRAAAVRATAAIRSAAATAADRVARAAAAVGRAACRARDSSVVRRAARLLAAGLTILVLVRAGAARRLVDLAGRVRETLGGAVAAARGWLGAMTLVRAAG
jgi:hypothetical protein